MDASISTNIIPDAAAAETASPPAKRKYTRKSSGQTTKKSSKAKSTKKKTAPKAPRYERIFSLDIGTRSVIGIVAEKTPDGLKIIDTERMEHKTRAMIDGQIHDVPQVAAVINSVRQALARRNGPLKSAAVAAAGRALYTMTASTDMEIKSIITREQERALDFAAVQAAQTQLANSQTIEDPSSYYCVGYSTIQYQLDGTQLKSLVGQRGNLASATVIATFLPKQVIDSIHSALQSIKLNMHALTLEPIAAINVLIPATMRHLNLVLIDIGAGTSDIAITRNSSVTAYGMVPQAGDEITDALSQHFLLDFNVAEEVKRDIGLGKNAVFTDILGMEYDLPPEEVIAPILPAIEKLADAISRQVLKLNGNTAPQAVMMVGGGSLTPHLNKYIAKNLQMPEARVAVRHPDKVEGIIDIPEELKKPDAVTPLGILKVASLNILHFLRVMVNDTEYSLFNFRDLTVSDALLNAGINLKKLNGRPGLGFVLKINGRSQFIPGTLGTMAQLTIDGKAASLDTPLHDGCQIQIIPGQNGIDPEVTLADVLEVQPSYEIYINGTVREIAPKYLINGQEAAMSQVLYDNDEITTKESSSLGEALAAAGMPPLGKKITFTLNGQPSQYTITPSILLNDMPAPLSQEVRPNDYIEYDAPEMPKLGDVLNLSKLDTHMTIYYEGQEHAIPNSSITLEVNGHTATASTLIEDGSDIRYAQSPRAVTSVSDVLLAVGFQPPSAQSKSSVTILLNGQPVIFTDPVKNGDELSVIITPRNLEV